MLKAMTAWRRTRFRSATGIFLAREELVEQDLVVLADRFDELVAPFLGQLLHVIRNLDDIDLLAEVVAEEVRLALEQVDDADEVALGAIGELGRVGGSSSGGRGWTGGPCRSRRRCGRAWLMSTGAGPCSRPRSASSFSDCGSTPATPSKMTQAPSRTRSERFTSTVKSMCPGVSIRLMR